AIHTRDSPSFPTRRSSDLPDFAFMAARTGLEPGVESFFYYSYDRAKSWKGPFKWPQFVWAGVAARTDYVVVNKDHCIVFLTANRSEEHTSELQSQSNLVCR